MSDYNEHDIRRLNNVLKNIENFIKEGIPKMPLDELMWSGRLVKSEIRNIIRHIDEDSNCSNKFKSKIHNVTIECFNNSYNKKTDLNGIYEILRNANEEFSEEHFPLNTCNFFKSVYDKLTKELNVENQSSSTIKKINFN